MAVKTVIVPNIGEVVLSRRKGTKHLRLSITSKGQVRVGMPYWAPYSAGIKFARERSAWIQQHLPAHGPALLRDGDSIGKAHKLFFSKSQKEAITTRVTATEILVKTSLPPSHPRAQLKAGTAAERALSIEAKSLLPQRLKELALKNNFDYRQVKTKKLTSRWGSCSSDKTVTLSYYLMQLPWHLTDYVLLHELVHTRHMNHSKAFWNDFLQVMPAAKQHQKEIRQYKPRLQPR